jgi:hypothetical protein
VSWMDGREGLLEKRNGGPVSPETVQKHMAPALQTDSERRP